MRLGILFVSACCFAGVAQAEETEFGHNFTAPSRIGGPDLHYPTKNWHRRQEGWVIVNYMVDPKGKPYDLVVSSSSGDERFEEAAIESLSQHDFEPATLDGEPVDAGQRSVVTYMWTSKALGMKKAFRSKYRLAKRAIEKGNRERADELFQKMWDSERNLYENAYYHLARYEYALKWETSDEQYEALKLATFNDKDLNFLADKTLAEILQKMLVLQLDRNLLSDAKRSARRISKLTEDEATRTEMAQMISSIDAKIASVEEVSVPYDFKGDSRLIHNLAKPSFAIASLAGDIAEIRLHCKAGHLILKPELDVRYRVKEGWSPCTLIMQGNPQTTFELVEAL